MSRLRLTSTHVEGCFNVRCHNSLGTVFTRHDGKGVAFVTAAHVLRGVQPGDNVLFKRINEWQPVKVRSVLRDPDGYDLAVFTADWAFRGHGDTEKRSPLLALGAEVKFLGFPHGLENSYPSENGYCTPLVRTAFFSGVSLIDGKELHIMDGFNNPGYSGGPVYGVMDGGTPSLVGIISGYKHERGEATQVFKRVADGRDEAVPDYFLKPNSGMIYVVGCNRLDKLMEQLGDRMPHV